MRASRLTILLLALILAAFAGLTTNVGAASFTIIPTNQNWRYIVPTDNAFCLNGTGWELTAFDDSGWAGPSPGGFTGGETTAATVTALAGWLNTSSLPAPTALLGRPYYFRTHFTLSDTNGLTLNFTNRVDDQAVWYINGVRVADDAHATTPETCTPQNPGGGEATTNFVFSLSPAQLGGIVVVGDNVLAVSVHQNATGSSDMVFGTHVAGEVASPASINYAASSLTNRTVAQCVGSTTLSVSAGGSPPPTYQWTHAGTNLPGATASTFTINNAQPEQGGAYHVVVSNPGATVTSTPDTIVTVTPDTTPPAALYAVRYLNPTNITLTNITVVFNESINTNNPDLWSNWTLVDTNTGNQVDMFGQIYPNSTTVVLDTDTLDPTHGYTLDLQLVFDTCANNEMAFITIPVYTFVSSPLSLTAGWKFLDNDVDPGATFFQPAFDDSGWFSGSGPFDAKRNGNYPVAPSNCRSNTLYMMQGPVPTCIRLESPVTVTNLITSNFRTHFNYTGKTNQTLLQLSGKFDDSAIVYLNGVEVWRVRLQASGVTRTTFANATVGDGDGRDILLLINSTNLHTGDNVIAVELHQQSLTSSDLTMGLEAHAFTLEALAGPVVQPVLHISANGSVSTITWTGGGTLQRSLNISSPANWVTIPGASSPFITNAPPAIQFFRVTVP